MIIPYLFVAHHIWYNGAVKKKYDLIFGLGPACSCSQALRKSGLQFLSFPFDWIGPTFGQPGWDDDVRRRTDLICSEFKDWLRPEDFTFHGSHTNGKDKYFNDRLGLMFLHDFPAGIRFQEHFPVLAEKYRRRCSRLLELIRGSEDVLLVRVDRPDLDYSTSLDDCRYAQAMLSRHFPQTRFDFVILHSDASLKPGECRKEQTDDGILRLTFDYRNHQPNADVTQPDHSATAAALGARFRVRDYRTSAEIAAWKRAKRLKRYARFGASNFPQYCWRAFRKAIASR